MTIRASLIRTSNRETTGRKTGMAAAANPAGGASLVDRNLQDAYTSLAWLRQALQAMAASDISAGGDPVMSLLQKLDWDKASVEDTIASLGRAGSSISDAVNDLQTLVKKADNAWDGEVFDLFRIFATGIQQDCTSVGQALEQQRTDVDGNKKGLLGDLGLKQTVFEGLDDLTGDVRKFAGDLTTRYAYESEMACNGDVQAQAAMRTAYNSLGQYVSDTVPKVANLQSGPKDHTAPVKFQSK